MNDHGEASRKSAHTESADLLVIGGGISGLTAAFEWKQRHPDHRVVVLDAAEHAGGVLHTVERDGFQFETAASSLRSPSATLLAMLEKLQLREELVQADPAARRRFLYWRGELRALPSNPFALFTTRLLRARDKWRLLRESAQPAGGTDDESVASFLARRFGAAVVHPFAQALVSGIYAGDVDRLEAISVFPQLVAAEREHGSVMRGLRRSRDPSEVGLRGMWALRGGFRSWIGALVERGGFEFQGGRKIDTLTESADGYELTDQQGGRWCAPRVHATSPASLESALRSLDGRLATVGAVERAPLAVIGLGYATEVVRPEHRGFGFLTADSRESAILGVLEESVVFPHRAPTGGMLLRVMMGGATRALAGDSDALLATARSELARILRIDEEPCFTEVRVVHDGIPQHTRGHQAKVKSLHESLRDHPGLTLGGWELGGIALGERVKEAQAFAEREPAATAAERSARAHAGTA